MKYIIALFIFLISCSAQAINFAIPSQVGSSANPIEPIKPSTKRLKFKQKPIGNKIKGKESSLDIINIFFAVCFLTGLVIFLLSFGLGSIGLFWLGLGFIAIALVWLLGLSLYAIISNNFPIIPISRSGIYAVFFLAGLLLVLVGLLLASAPFWIIGSCFSLLAILSWAVEKIYQNSKKPKKEKKNTKPKEKIHPVQYAGLGFFLLMALLFVLLGIAYLWLIPTVAFIVTSIVLLINHRL